MAAQIEWDPRTLRLLQPGGNYGRIARQPNGDLAFVYDQNRAIWVRLSRDEGKTWGAPVRVAAWPHGPLTNAELLALRNGALLCLYNARPDPTSGRPFAICLARSHDGGRTWQPPVTLYEGGAEFTNGCWEPAAVELSGGEIQVFFANESPYRASAEQEITLLRSRDGARNWDRPQTISFRAGFRDGMPSPLVLQSGEIAVAIEDNGLNGPRGGNFKPVLVRTNPIDNWRSGAVTGANPRRQSALRVPLAPSVYAGAPYLRQMPTGETLLSFQQSDAGDLKTARMVVCVGDAHARNFANPTFPFPPGAAAAQVWNSLFVKDRRTVCALSSTAINGVWGVWSIEGRFA